MQVSTAIGAIARADSDEAAAKKSSEGKMSRYVTGCCVTSQIASCSHILSVDEMMMSFSRRSRKGAIRVANENQAVLRSVLNKLLHFTVVIISSVIHFANFCILDPLRIIPHSCVWSFVFL